MHDLENGVAPATLMMVIHIIEECSKIVDNRWRSGCALFDLRTSTARSSKGFQVPKFEHLNWTDYNRGLFTILGRTEIGENNTGIGGSLGGMRSSWSLNQCLKAIFAIGLNGDLIPNEDIVVKQRIKAKTTVNRAAFVRQVR